MKLKKCLYIILFFLFCILVLFTTKSYAGELELKNLNYDVTLNSDGTAYVTETWDIEIEDTNTLFKTFDINSSRYKGIEDVSVTEITQNKNKRFTEIFKEKYHVDKDCFYALKNSKGKFEIAWGVNEDDSYARRVFEVSYKIVDAVKNYNDCSEFYWKFISTDSAIPAKNVTGTVKLPMAVEVLDDLRVWAHGPLNGNIERTSTDTVSFNVSKLNTRTMLEVRIMTPTYVFSNNNNIVNVNKSESILKEEQGWADKANAERERSKLIWTGLIIVAIAITSVFAAIIIKYIVDGRKLKKMYPKKQFDIEYFRDIPNEETATPANAAYLYYFTKNKSLMNLNLSKIFSATMLDLALKGVITIEPIDEKVFNIVLNFDKAENLPNDEKTVFNVLKSAAEGNDRVSTKDLLKYSKKHYESVYPKLKLIPTYAEKYHVSESNFDEEKKKISKKWKTKSTVYVTIFAVLISMFAFIPPVWIIIILLGICSAICTGNSNKVSILSDKGEEERAQWKGLKKYMDDFSLLKDKEVPDLALWEKYLVYATAFGISAKVIKELKVVYKEFSDPEYFNTHHYAYMYYMTDPRFGNNFISTFDKTMSSVYTSASNAYSAAHSSSSSGGGFGGGFSGGGGGRRRRRPEWADVKIKSMNNKKEKVAILFLFLCVFRYFACCKFITTIIKFIISMSFYFYKLYFMNFCVII